MGGVIRILDTLLDKARGHADLFVDRLDGDPLQIFDIGIDLAGSFVDVDDPDMPNPKG